MRRDVVEPVGPDVAVAEAAEVGDDHLEAGRGERLDHLPEDALGLGPAVHAHERHAAEPLAHEGLAEAARRRGVDREAGRVELGQSRARRHPRVAGDDRPRASAAVRDPRRVPPHGHDARSTGSPTTSRASSSCPVRLAGRARRRPRPCCRRRRPPHPSPSTPCSPTSTGSSCPASPTGSTRASSPTSRPTSPTRRSSASWPRPASACRGCCGPRARRAPRSSRSMLDWMVELLGPARPLPHRRRRAAASSRTAPRAPRCAPSWRPASGRPAVAPTATGTAGGLVAYATRQAHSSIEKGVRIAGIGSDNLRLVDVDDALRHAARRAGRSHRRRPRRRAACRSSWWPPPAPRRRWPSTRCPRSPTICRREGVWLHVDGAMAGIAALCPELRWVNDGLDRADSYGTNPHKWMGVNFDCNLFWVADRAAAAAGAVDPARVPAHRGQRVGRRRRLPRLAGPARTPVPRPQAVVRAARRRRRPGPGDDRAATSSWPTERRRLGRGRRRASSWPRRRRSTSSCSASGRRRRHRRADRRGQRLRRARCSPAPCSDGRSALRFCIGGRTTERRHVEAAWALLQDLAG